MTIERCEAKRCCLNSTGTLPGATGCLNASLFASVQKSTRVYFGARVSIAGFNQGGICSNCQAKAAFLAIAATMTDHFRRKSTSWRGLPVSSTCLLRPSESDHERTSGCPCFPIPMIGKGRECSDQSNCHGHRCEDLFQYRFGRSYVVQLELPQRITHSGMFEPPFTPLADGTFLGFSTLC